MSGLGVQLHTWTVSTITPTGLLLHTVVEHAGRYQLAFMQDLSWHSVDQWLALFILEQCITVFFLCDMVVNFRSSWVDGEGRMVFNQRERAKQYLKMCVVRISAKTQHCHATHSARCAAAFVLTMTTLWRAFVPFASGRWFWIDVVSTVPWEALELTQPNTGARGAAGAALKVPKLLRLLRLTKLLKILRGMQLFQRWEQMIVKHVRV